MRNPTTSVGGIAVGNTMEKGSGANRKRSESLSVRVTPAEREKITRDAQAKNLSREQYVRFMLLSAEARALPDAGGFYLTISDQVGAVREDVRRLQRDLILTGNYTEQREKKLYAHMRELNRTLLEIKQLISVHTS